MPRARPRKLRSLIPGRDAAGLGGVQLSNGLSEDRTRRSLYFSFSESSSSSPSRMIVAVAVVKSPTARLFPEPSSPA